MIYFSNIPLTTKRRIELVGVSNGSRKTILGATSMVQAERVEYRVYGDDGGMEDNWKTAGCTS